MTWGSAAIFGVLLLLAGGAYIRLRWSRSPLAYRAMIALAVCFFIAGALLGAWLFHARAEPSASALASVEVIPGKLKVRVFLHDIESAPGQSFPCWSYVTDGLATHGQKEIIFTLRRTKILKPEDYPRDTFRVLAQVFHSTERGEVFDIGDQVEWNSTESFGMEGFRGIAFVSPSRYAKVPGNYKLAAIGLLGDEPQIVRNFGITRVTSLLGRKYSFYPYPRWSDPTRGRSLP